MAEEQKMISDLSSLVEKQGEENKRHEKKISEIDEAIKKALAALGKAGLAFEVRSEETLKSPCATKARYIIPKDWSDVLEKMQLPEEAIQKLKIKASGKDLIYWLKKAGWKQILNTNIWVKSTSTNSLNYWIEHPEYEFIAFFHTYSVVLVRAKDGKVYILDSDSEERLTSGHLDGEANSSDIIQLKKRKNIYESYEIKSRRFIK